MQRHQVLPEGLMLGLSAVLGSVIVLAGLLLAVRFMGDDQPTGIDAGAAGELDGDSDDGAGPPSEPATTASDEEPGAGADDADGPDTDAEPPETPAIEPLACPDDVDEVICEAAEFVQQARGRPFQTFPVIQVMSDDEFDAELLESFDEETRDVIRRDEAVLKALGLLDPQISLVDAYLEATEVGVVGFYDPADGSLVVRGDELDLYGQLIMVHELTHAFDDQWFDLSREDFIDADAEYAYAAVVEGNASRVEELWRADLSAADAAQLNEQEFNSIPPDDLQRLLAIPPVLQELLSSPYLDGFFYVDELAAAGGEAAVDAALTTPPTSSEEILHPGLDRATDPEVKVATPPAEPGGTGDGGASDEGRIGELLIDLWLGNLAGDGWGGDRFVTWPDGAGRTCLTVDIVGDTAQDLIEIETTAEGWAQAQPDDRSVEPVTTADHSALRLTGCP